jgi:hypothetical protein
MIYGDRTIIGFVGFVANLLNRPTDGATVSVRKSASEKELLFVRLWVRKITVTKLENSFSPCLNCVRKSSIKRPTIYVFNGAQYSISGADLRDPACRSTSSLFLVAGH